MLRVCHQLLLNTTQIYDGLMQIWQKWSLTTTIVEGKRPNHVLLVGDCPLSLQHLAVLELEARALGIKQVTIMYDGSIAYRSEILKILPRTQREEYCNFLSYQRGPLTALPGSPVDLVISTQEDLDLSGLDGTLLGFAEFFHCPVGEFVTLPVWRSALSQYAKCKQNFGK